MILITGATGGLGAEVAKFLKEKNTKEPMAVMARNHEHEKIKQLAADGFEVRIADYNDPTSLLKAFRGVSLLYFISGNDFQHRAQQHKNVVEAARQAAIGHIFYTSVSLNGLSESSPLFPAMNDHLLTEQWIKESGLKYTLLRHNLYAEVIPMFLGTKENLLASKSVFLPAGEGKTAFVPRSELAEAGANALLNASACVNGAYEMNGSECVTFGQIAEMLSDITGQSIGYISPAPEVFVPAMQEFGVPAEYIGMMVAFGAGIAEGAFYGAGKDLEMLLGRPSLSVKSFLQPVYGN
jgi:NAD(P)H dehydrogenase (quinone)